MGTSVLVDSASQFASQERDLLIKYILAYSMDHAEFRVIEGALTPTITVHFCVPTRKGEMTHARKLAQVAQVEEAVEAFKSLTTIPVSRAAVAIQMIPQVGLRLGIVGLTDADKERICRESGVVLELDIESGTLKPAASAE